jgi:tetratricopeptide (TPR) repeat protein
MLEAEVLASMGKSTAALATFDAAIKHAHKGKVWHEKGLVCEQAGALLHREKRPQEAILYDEQAIEAYEVWGATAKVSLLCRKIPVRIRGTQDPETRL